MDSARPGHGGIKSGRENLAAGSRRRDRALGAAPVPRHGAARALSFLVESELGSRFLFEHDLFRKPVPTFRDHALMLREPALLLLLLLLLPLLLLLLLLLLPLLLLLLLLLLHRCPQDRRPAGFRSGEFLRQDGVFIREPVPASCDVGIDRHCRQVPAAFGFGAVMESVGHSGRQFPRRRLVPAADMKNSARGIGAGALGQTTGRLPPERACAP